MNSFNNYRFRVSHTHKKKSNFLMGVCELYWDEVARSSQKSKVPILSRVYYISSVDSLNNNKKTATGKRL